MELEGVVHNGVIVPDDAHALTEGTRVRIEPVNVGKPTTFGQLFGDLVVDGPDLPTTQLVITPTLDQSRGSIADAFGTAPVLRSGDDILAQVRTERDEWGDR